MVNQIMFNCITFEVSPDKIATLTFIREKVLNSINNETLKELDELLSQLEANKGDVRVLIIKGKGKAFIAGADIKEFEGKTVSGIKVFSVFFQGILNRLEMLPIPTIAVIDGYCLGGGCELAMACDLRIASEKAIFGQPEIKLGLIPGAGGTQRLPRLIGKTRAKEMIFLGGNISAEKAESIGLINQVAPSEELDSIVDKIANKLAKGPSFALAQAKESIDRGTEIAWLDAIQMEANYFSLCFSHDDFKEGVSAFLEKRKANFE